MTTDFAEKDVTRAFREFDTAVDALIQSNHKTFHGNLRSLMFILGERKVFSEILSSELPDVNFEEWYSLAKKTHGGTVGDGQLEWPIEPSEKLAMQKALLENMSKGNDGPVDFCMTFMFVGTRVDDMVAEFNTQIVEPFCRSIRDLVEESISIAPAVAEVWNQQQHEPARNDHTLTTRKQGGTPGQLMGESSLQPRVFLSHSKLDACFIERVHKDLRACHLYSWLDIEEIRHGEPWLDAIFRDGIPTCHVVIVYLTPNSLTSGMVQKEMNAASQLFEDRGVALLPYVSSEDVRKKVRADILTVQIPVWNDANYLEMLPQVVSAVWHGYAKSLLRDRIRLDTIVPALLFPAAVLRHCSEVLRARLIAPNVAVPFRCDAQMTFTDRKGKILFHECESSLGENACKHQGQILWSDFPSDNKTQPFKAAISSDVSKGFVMWLDRGYSALKGAINPRDSHRVCLAFFLRPTADEYVFLEMHEELAEPLDARASAVLVEAIRERVGLVEWEPEEV